jgi:hypothetical protein
MRSANLSKHLHGLFIFICLICLFPLFPLAANGTSLADLAGTWRGSGFATGLGVALRQTIILTVKPDGKFTGSDKNDNSSFSGIFSISSDGIVPTVPGNTDITQPLCQINSDNTVLVCTETWDDGSSNLMIFTKRAASYSMADLAGSWEGNFLISSGQTSGGLVTVSDTISSDGTFTGTVTVDGGTPTAISGQMAISPSGVITCLSGSCLDPTYESFMNAGKTVTVGTSGAAPLQVFTKKAASYSMADLAGPWNGNSLASGPGAPWWERSTGTIEPDGTFTGSTTQSDGSTKNKTATFTLSSDGVITSPSSSTASGVMDADKTVMVITDTWSDGTAEIKIFTKNLSLTAPGAPTGVTATAGNALATVSFTPPASTGGSPITRYTVTSIPGGKTAKGSATQITVKGLKNGTPYTFTVTATNKHGTGPASTASNPPVIPATVPGAPKGIKATAGNEQASLSFMAPASNGGSPITGYTLTWSPTGGVDNDAGTTSTTHTVTGLTNGTTYTFTVKATNAMGTGPASHSIRLTPATVPGAPTIGTVTAGKKQATVNFTLPASEDGGDPITSYIVTPYIETVAGKATSGPHSPITVKGLASGTAYTFTVAAKNKMGTGPASTASGQVTPQ